MQLRILQLNINAGTHLAKVQQLLTTHDFDICIFQEVTGSHFRHNVLYSNIDTYKVLQNSLQANYESVLAISSVSSSDPVNGFLANAIFYRKGFTLIEKNVLMLSKGLEPFPSDYTTFEEVGRNALHLTLSQDKKVFDIINTHLSWASTPTEQPHQSQQNKKLVEYIQSLQSPFILAGDFNLTSDQPTIVQLEKYARNLTREYHVENTLDPENHKVFEKIPQGLAVDYIFVSPQIKVNAFRVIQEDLSDHLGLEATITI